MRRINKEAILADAKKRTREYKERQKSLFNQRYNKTEVFEFPEASEIDMNRFFFFPKFDEDFCMSLPSIAIYPVLCLQSDFKQNNWFHISQKNIAKMAGLHVNTVVKGIKDLEKKTLRGECSGWPVFGGAERGRGKNSSRSPRTGRSRPDSRTTPCPSRTPLCRRGEWRPG